jgi:vesicle-associated membrane protein 7
MSIKYSCLIYQNNIIANYCNDNNVTNDMKNKISYLSKCVSKTDELRLCIDGEICYGIICISRNFHVLCLACNTKQKRVVSLCLKEIIKGISQHLSLYQAENFSNETLKIIQDILEEKTNYYNDPKNDALQLIRSQLDETKNVMLENLDRVFERGEKIEILCDQTTLLLDTSSSFQKNSTDLRRKMMWKNIKYGIAIIFAILLIILVIVMIACNPNFSKCKK